MEDDHDTYASATNFGGGAAGGGGASSVASAAKKTSMFLSRTP